MKNYVMIDPNTKEVKLRYQADQPCDDVWLRRPPHAEHLEVPDGIELAYAYVDSDGVVQMDHAAASEAAVARSNQQWADLRAKRDALLAACDWTQIADSPLSDEVKAAWRTYRQALRDLPENTQDPAVVSWPVAPS